MSYSYKKLKLELLSLIQDKIFSIDPFDPDTHLFIIELQSLSDDISEDNFVEAELSRIQCDFEDVKRAA